MPTTRPFAAVLGPVLAPIVATALAVSVVPVSPAAAADLDFLEQSLELPGAPAALVPADLDGDGHPEVVIHRPRQGGGELLILRR